MEQETPLTDHQWGDWKKVEILDGDYVITEKRTCNICQAEETKRKPLISKEEKKVGYYADIDADGKVDGVIYADLAQGGSGKWGKNNVAYTVPKITEGLKRYYVSQENYTDKFGTKDVLSPIGEGNNRFYVMALKDIGDSTYWWKTRYLSLNTSWTSVDFGKGRDNSTSMWGKINSGNTNSHDMWEKTNITEEQIDSGWFVPSKGEWLAFAGNLGVTRSNYSSYGMSGTYWTSSISTSSRAWNLDFSPGYYVASTNTAFENYVRLSITF